MTIDRINDVITKSVANDSTNSTAAIVRLTFKVDDPRSELIGTIETKASVRHKMGAPEGRVHGRIIQRAWEWLEAYMSGDLLEGDEKNIFECVSTEDRHTASRSSLSFEQEKSLQDELSEIALEIKGGAQRRAANLSVPLAV